MKTCTKCKIDKHHIAFSKNSKSKDGLGVHCKECCNSKKKEHYYLNKEKLRALGKKYYNENRCDILNKAKIYVREKKEELKKRRREYYLANVEKLKQKRINYYINNKEKVKEYDQNRLLKNRKYFNAKSAKRRAELLKRTPKWLTSAQFKIIEGFYKLALSLREATGINHDVDHIIPLQGKLVSGLHVPWNLQVITSTENSRKGNRL